VSEVEPRIGGQARTSFEEEQLMTALTLMDLTQRLRVASRLRRKN